MAKYLFFDTNIFLHYQDVEQLNLEQRYGKGVVLVIPRVILGELNKHKDSHKSATIQKRARSVCKKIHTWDGSGQVTDNIKFQFVVKTSDPKKHDLNPDSADDRFLADILEFDAPQEDKILIAADMNMILTAKHLGIITEEIDENFKLPSSLDPLEKENRELQRKLSRLQNALPKLEVGLIESKDDSDVDSNPVFQISKPKLLSDAEIEDKVSNLKAERFTPPIENALLMAFAEQGEINRYNKECSCYPDRYRKYLYELRECQKRCGIHFQIAIINNGTAPAKDVDVSFNFPDRFDMYLEDELPDYPHEPSLPQKPKTFAEQMRESITGNLRIQNLYRVPSVKLPTSYTLKRTNSYDFIDSFRLIKHHEKAILPELFLFFPSYEQIKSFQCTYRITVANLPDIVDGVINFKFDTGHFSEGEN